MSSLTLKRVYFRCALFDCCEYRDPISCGRKQNTKLTYAIAIPGPPIYKLSYLSSPQTLRIYLRSLFLVLKGCLPSVKNLKQNKLIRGILLSKYFVEERRVDVTWLVWRYKNVRDKENLFSFIYEYLHYNPHRIQYRNL